MMNSFYPLSLKLGLLILISACGNDASSATSESTSLPPAESSGTGPVTQVVSSQQVSPAVSPPIDALTGYIDPVCQMKIAEDAPLRHTFESVTYGFCSESCLERFSAEPAKYLAALEE